MDKICQNDNMTPRYIVENNVPPKMRDTTIHTGRTVSGRKNNDLQLQ